MKMNKLQYEKSPYLLQHCTNPVEWYPWSDEAFEKARLEEKPVFLSIGYSTCHWCHVMERESFEDTEIANMMNEVFVNIKVDREERPDIDGVYMAVCQMLTGSGGWPLTVIMTPEKKPFFAGTYFPKHSIYGRIGMSELIEKLRILWKERRLDAINSAEDLTNQLRRYVESDRGSIEITNEIFHRAYSGLTRNYDSKNGGFSVAPKFPIPHNFTFLLRYWKETGEKNALGMVEQTLRSMRQGGIYDHLGFGFHRYSTDEQWLVPHFEKMLYDQALLLSAYTDCYLATKDNFYKNTAEEIVEYVIRDLTDANGAFLSAEDADSEGVEGKFYIWKSEEIDEILGEDAVFFKDVFNISTNGNFLEERGEIPVKTNILHRSKTDEELAKKFNITIAEFNDKLEKCRRKVFDYRKTRVHPHKDDKVLTDWNGLMIAALAEASRAFNNDDYYNSAVKSAEFILENLLTNNGLLHRYRDGDTSIDGQLDDFAFFAIALIELYQTGFEVKYLKRSIELTDIILDKFADKQRGGFYAISESSEELIIRKKDIYDGAQPSGNSIMLLLLNRLFLITGDEKYRSTANSIIKYFSKEISQMPLAYTQLLNGLYYNMGKGIVIIIASDEDNNSSQKFIDSINSKFLPSKIMLKLTPQAQMQGIANIAPFLKEYPYTKCKTNVYICKDFQCNAPINSIEELKRVLS